MTLRRHFKFSQAQGASRIHSILLHDHMSIAKSKSTSFARLHDYSFHNNILSPTHRSCFRLLRTLSSGPGHLRMLGAEMRRCGLVDGLPNVQRAYEHSVAVHERSVMYGSAG
jgi:hypothetical protein